MGCGSSLKPFFIVQYCSLIPITNKENCYKIDFIGEENLTKIEGITFLNQCGAKKESTIIGFLERDNFKEKTIFYYYLREKPIIKTYYQSLKYQPFSLPKLFHIILLSIDSVENIPNELIEKETQNFVYNEFIGQELNFNEIKNKLDEANNPNITKDNITLNSVTEYEEDEEIKEKDNEIIICGELNKELLDKIIFKFENVNKNINNIIIKKDDKNENEDLNHNQNVNQNIDSIKIFSSKFENISLLDKLMKFLQNKKIQKFYFYNNNSNSEFEGWDSINDFLDNNYYVRYLDLHCCTLFDNNLNSLMRALSDKRIRFLNISENFFTLEGIKIIASFLKNNKTLQKLNLCRNSQTEFKAEGVQSILESLNLSQNIEFIDFSYMNLTGCGKYVGNFLLTNKSLEILMLKKTKLNVIDFKNIFESIKNNNTIKEIDISLNDMGGDKSLQYISDGIKENKSLTCLKMDQININNDNYQIIFEGIEQNNNISYYTVNYNSKIKPIIMLDFFIKQMQVKKLEYIPYDKDNIEVKTKALTLDEKKYIEKLKTERPDMKLTYK